MANATANVTTRDFTNESNLLIRTGMNMTAGVTGYAGTIVARHAAGTVSNPDGTLPVLGVLMDYADPATATRIGWNFVGYFTLSGVTVADVGKTVYASDNQTITLTPTVGPSPLGQILKVTGTDECAVFVTCQAAPKTFS